MNRIMVLRISRKSSAVYFFNKINPALNGKPCRRSRLKRSGSGEPVNAYINFSELHLTAQAEKLYPVLRLKSLVF
jgi:hypothetical protein